MLIFFGLVVLAFFGIFIKMNYSVDTYLLFASRNLEYIQEYVRSGRLSTAFLFKFLQFLEFDPEVMYVVSYLIGIVCTSCAIYILYNVLSKYINNKTINSILSIMIIVNPFIIELWLFVETGIMIMSILFCVLAYKYFDKYLEKYQNKEIILSIFFMTIAVFSYQGTVALFLALSVISIVANNKNYLKNTL